MNRRKLLLGVKLLISGGFIVALYSTVDRSAVGEQLSRVDWRLAPLVYGMLLANTLISSCKWRLLLAADAINLPYRTLVGSYFIGTFFNAFLPSSIGGDVYRVYDISRRSGKSAQSLASVVADRLTGVLAVVVIGLVFSFCGYHLLPSHRVVVVPLVFFSAMVVAIWVLYQRRLLRGLMHVVRLDRVETMRRFVDSFLSSLDVYRGHWRVLVRVIALSFVYQSTVVVYVYTMAQCLGLEVAFVFYWIFVPLITLVEAIPVSIYGLGIRDGAYVFFFAQAGLERSHALALALLYVLLTLGYSAVGGIVFLCRRRRA